MRRCVFLDRDGVINVKPPDGEYVRRWPGGAGCASSPSGGDAWSIPWKGRGRRSLRRVGGLESRL
jgi:hypothetical protein